MVFRQCTDWSAKFRRTGCALLTSLILLRPRRRYREFIATVKIAAVRQSDRRASTLWGSGPVSGPVAVRACHCDSELTCVSVYSRESVSNGLGDSYQTYPSLVSHANVRCEAGLQKS